MKLNDMQAKALEANFDEDDMRSFLKKALGINCPIIISVMAEINEGTDEIGRERLTLFLDRLLETNKSTIHERTEYLAWHLARVTTPNALNRAGLNEHAENIKNQFSSGNIAKSASLAAEAAEVLADNSDSVFFDTDGYHADLYAAIRTSSSLDYVMGKLYPSVSYTDEEKKNEYYIIARYVADGVIFASHGDWDELFDILENLFQIGVPQYKTPIPKPKAWVSGYSK